MSTNLRSTLKLIVGAVGFLAMLIAIQAVLAHYNRRIDLTLQQKFTLAPRTQHVVSNLQQEVRAIAFIHPDRPENFFWPTCWAAWRPCRRTFITPLSI